MAVRAESRRPNFMAGSLVTDGGQARSVMLYESLHRPPVEENLGLVRAGAKAGWLERMGMGK
jgi:hypothetical protein